MKQVLVVLMMVSGCSMLTEPSVAPSSDFAPPAYYAQLWRQIDSCSGLPRSMASVRFAVAITDDPDRFHTARHGWAVGQYDPAADRIILAPSAVADSTRRVMSAVARHEMLHAHLRGNTEHPAEYFGSPPTWTDGKCGVLVSH